MEKIINNNKTKFFLLLFLIILTGILCYLSITKGFIKNTCRVSQPTECSDRLILWAEEK